MSSTSTIFRPAPRIEAIDSQMLRNPESTNREPEKVFGVDFIDSQMVSAELNGVGYDVLNSNKMEVPNEDGRVRVLIERQGEMIVDELVDVVFMRLFTLTYEPPTMTTSLQQMGNPYKAESEEE